MTLRKCFGSTESLIAPTLIGQRRQGLYCTRVALCRRVILIGSELPGKVYDLAVVGLGAMGAAVAWHASRRGLRVIGFDRYEPPHAMGSSHAETRITRLAVGEGDQYLPFVARSHELWRELATLSGEQLLFQSGGWILSDPSVADPDRWDDFVAETAAVAARGGIEFEVLTPAELRQRQPQLIVNDDIRVGFEPTAGVVLSERAIAAQLAAARAGGATLHGNERVTAVNPDAAGVDVSTDKDDYRARNVVICTGAWLPELAAVDAQSLTVTRQEVFWFEVQDLERWHHSEFSGVIWSGQTASDYLGIFPIIDGNRQAVKILSEQFEVVTTADAADREVSADAVAHMYEARVRPRLRGVLPNCIDAAACLYTNTPDDHFLIDHHPESERIMVMSPCSGHGFKHSTALGEAVVAMIASDIGLDLSAFARSR